MLELRGVIKRYGTTAALGPIDLRVDEANTTVLLGPSGCGKSTALRAMLGLIKPSEGEVLFEGEPISREARRRAGYVIQDGGLFPHLTARANLIIQPLEFGIARAEAEARVSELSELTSFPRDGLDRYPAELSGGQRQRVALMRSLMLDPDVLLMDEPLGALDPVTRADLQSDLRDIFRSLGKTVVLVTHDLAEAAYLGDRIVLMERGEIAQAGRFEDLRDAPASDFVRRFVSAHRSVPMGAGS
ncbi:MAG: ATP-binding cassette domain-containing protein [Planctomycetota bacterium]